MLRSEGPAFFALPQEEIRETRKVDYPRRSSSPTYRRPSRPAPVELNSADSATLVKIRGIGPYYASRILQYRERLGGFHSATQLKELNAKYLVVDSLLPFLTVDASLIRKRDIDTMSFTTLLRHPYLEYEDVTLIFDAKRAGGGRISYSLLEEKKVLPPRTLKKIKPYFL
ncbi:MAG: helix-hairpin-helix domain-containing protein [Odoribacteraceae bacterium]|nr:helix-hairpin-helix domain-containing protein [Odoribacteraceae bacterium]